ncbi:MAG: glycosyl hydrolase 53 family protein [Bacteroidota bacterium]|nr:glycosyl hydrolase 53 family protein [Bacteroidota bacterium]
MFKKPALFLFLLLFFSAIKSQDRAHINIDENWKFHLGNAADPLKDFNYGIADIFKKSGDAGNTAINPRFNDSSWRTINLPHDWVVELPFVNSPNFDVMAHGYKPVGGLFPATSIGWYRKRFFIDKKDSAKRISIQFDGIYRDANIWLNGFFIGNNKSGYIGAEYDVSDFIKYGEENTLVVRVDATQYEGWFYEGAGIYRHVWLNKTNNFHINSNKLFIHSKQSAKNAIVSVEIPVVNQESNIANGYVYTYITTRDGKKVAGSKPTNFAISSFGKNVLKQSINVANPHLWSIEDPYLYRVVTLLKSGNKVIDSVNTRFGIRDVNVTAKGLFINGKYVKIKGFCNHQDHAGVGSALPDYLQYYRIGLLKQMGANAYRTSHNPPTPELLDACDSLGMIVLDENRLLNSSPEYMDQFERLILRDRNHASVFMWSIGNEEGWIQATPTGQRIALSLLHKQKELDPYRTSTYAADEGNVYKGINQVIPVRGFNYRIKGIEPYHEDHPDQPIMGTEMASTLTTRGIYKVDTVHDYLPDHDITAPPWGNTAEQWWKPAAEESWFLGGFVWTGFDYRGEPTPYKWPNISSHFGVMDVCGFPKNVYYYYQAWWSDKDVLQISPHWNWKGEEGKPIDVWVNSNADNVELFLNGKSFGKKDMPRNSHLQWTVPYEPGKLEAIAYKHGRKLVSSVETTGDPAEVVITPYKTTMLADGKDATVINVSVVDKQGREVPTADNLIQFSITGDAKIIGVGNGDPSSHEPDKILEGQWQRSLFNGKCQVILQAGKTPGHIKFVASSKGLWDGSTDIITVKPDQPLGIADDPYLFSKLGIHSTAKPAGKILGADISFLPQLEARGIKFSDKGEQKDVLQILKDHGFNYIRLRLFVNPSDDSGYSPGKGFCDLQQTLQMAKRIKNAGMKFLLDFHYSDTWADPGKQFIPEEWKSLDFKDLAKKVHDYTKSVLASLKAQGTLPEMVQTGNEINHGILWPDGNVQHLDSLATLLNSALSAVKEVNPSIITLIHVALGGQNSESEFFLDNMINRGVSFDAIGESYYPKWHGTLNDLDTNLRLLQKKYNKPVIVAEYSQLKRQVNRIAFSLPGNQMKGTFIWEPLSTWESFFDKDGKANKYLYEYDDITHEFLKDQH